jgi:hypothetical protein
MIVPTKILTADRDFAQVEDFSNEEKKEIMEIKANDYAMYPKDIMPIIEKIELLRIRDKK